MGQSVRLQGDKCRIYQNLMPCSAFNLPHFSDCSSHREHIQGFFLHQGITELCKTFEGLALKTSAFQYFYGSKIDLRPCGTPIYEANFACASSFKTLICRLS